MSAKWEIVGGFLGLSISVIDNIKATPPVTTVGCWHDALKNWIKQNYNTGKHALPSWRSLLAAVARVDRLLFKKLAAAHPGEVKRCTKHKSDAFLFLFWAYSLKNSPLY